MMLARGLCAFGRGRCGPVLGAGMATWFEAPFLRQGAGQGFDCSA
jgi:hypothetical protein